MHRDKSAEVELESSRLKHPVRGIIFFWYEESMGKEFLKSGDVEIEK